MPAARALLQRQIDGLEAASANLLAPVREKFKKDNSGGGVGGDAFTEDGFKRAVSMVLSRAFQVMINDDKHLVILPVVDWLNHSDDLPPASVPVSFDRETSIFNVRAVQSYKQGDHVWITYGAKVGALSPAKPVYSLQFYTFLSCAVAPSRGQKSILSLTFPRFLCAGGCRALGSLWFLCWPVQARYGRSDRRSRPCSTWPNQISIRRRPPPLLLSSSPPLLFSSSPPLLLSSPHISPLFLIHDIPCYVPCFFCRTRRRQWPSPCCRALSP